MLKHLINNPEESRMRGLFQESPIDKVNHSIAPVVLMVIGILVFFIA